ncbi:MAG TPA: ribonuclease BN [Nocardioides bacterium]|nr:ribonuclease BN [Nocardioides sp.]HRD59954.1 YhjD/YihY/BrkB family envelope integrity protein [Nocardioides sp.]
MERALGLLPPRFEGRARWLLGTWPGRIGVGTAWSLQRIEIFDRAMAVAAQLFTSVFPMLILLASWFGNTSQLLTNTLGMPPEAEAQVDTALQESGSTAFGLIGALIVFASATSLSRALGRAFAAVWALSKPKSSPRAVWRWVAVVLVLALTMWAIRRSETVADGIPPPHLWGQVIAFVMLVAVALFTPWVLLHGAVTARALLPGAVLFGIVMSFVRPISNVWLAHALEASASRYGSIGVAFTYLAWLYVFAWIFLATAIIGQVLVTDEGRVARWLAGPKPVVRTERSDAADEVLIEDQP